MGTTLTYAELERLSAAFAAYLQQHTDLKPGDRDRAQHALALDFLKAGLLDRAEDACALAREVQAKVRASRGQGA